MTIVLEDRPGNVYGCRLLGCFFLVSFNLCYLLYNYYTRGFNVCSKHDTGLENYDIKIKSGMKKKLKPKSPPSEIKSLNSPRIRENTAVGQEEFMLGKGCVEQVTRMVLLLVITLYMVESLYSSIHFCFKIYYASWHSRSSA